MKNLHGCILLIALAFTGNMFAQNVDIKVTDSYEGAALSGVKVESICKDMTAYTNSSGKATLNLNLEQCCNVKFTKIGYAPESVEVCPGDNFIELSFYKTYTIKGVLKGETGKTLNRTRVEMTSDCGDGQRVVYTDAAGWFKLTPPAIGSCCYELVISHAEYPKNTAVFCTTDEVLSKDVQIYPSVSSTELFNTVKVTYTSKTLAPLPVVTTISSEPNYIGTPPPAPVRIIYATPEPRTIVSSSPTYTPTTSYTPSTYTPPAPVYEPPVVPPTTTPTASVSYKNKYIDATNLSVSDAMPSSANFSYFDFNQAYIRPDSYSYLDNVVSFMQSHPDLVVEIGVHCDSRGDYTFNQVFSEQRARALADYLVGKGIGSNRLIVRGYGESQLLNHCTDGVPCSTEEHRQNRRSIFRVQGNIYDAGYSVSQSYQSYQAPVFVNPPPTTTTAPSPTVSPVPPGAPCPDCPVPELDDEEYMDKLHGEEYFDDNFYDENDGGND